MIAIDERLRDRLSDRWDDPFLAGDDVYGWTIGEPIMYNQATNTGGLKLIGSLADLMREMEETL